MDWIPSATALALTVPLIILLVLWILLLMIQPICVVIDCLFSKLPLHRKVIWLLVMFFSLGLATTFYPYMVSESRFLRWVTIVTYLPIILLLAIYLLLFIFNPDVRDLVFQIFDYLHAWISGGESL